MFYRTQIKAVTDTAVIDMDGKPLQFIGWLPVKAGDWVFTDGRYIFGNVPPKGSPAVFADDEPSGIPVLGDESFLSEKETTLRGYFDKNKKFKSYAVAWDDWIVNSEKNFAHGVEAFENGKIIDADISDDGTELIVTGGFSRTNNVVKSSFIMFDCDSRLWDNEMWHTRPQAYPQDLGSDIFPDDDSPTRFYEVRNSGTHSEDINLDDYAEDVEEHALLAAEKIMEKSYTREEGSYYVTVESLADDAYSPPNAPVIVQTTAQIISCYPDEENDSGVGGIVFAATYGYCFPHIEPRFTRYRNVKIDEWKCIPFGFSAFYKITDDDPEPISYRYYGGASFYSAFIDENDGVFVSQVFGAPNGYVANVVQYRYDDLSFELAELDTFEGNLFPVGDGFYSMNKFGQLTFYNSEQEIIAEEIPVHENFLHVELAHAEYDPHYVILLFNNKPHVNCKLYTSDGEVQDKILYLDNLAWTYVQRDNAGNIVSILEEVNETAETKIPIIDGYYIRNADDSLEPLQFTPLFYQFKDGSYLYGVRGGELIFQDKDGKETSIGNGIRNFRLKELKKISKAKR